MRPIVEQICASRPTLACGPVTVSTEELLGRAAQLATELRSAGVERGDIVALLSSRSCDDVIGILGILWSGAAFVVLEPVSANLVAGRLEQLGARFVVGGADELKSRLIGPNGLRAFEVPVNVSRLFPEAVSEPSDPAYVVCTSGSTGKPKPILVTHANLLTYCSSVTERLGGPKVFRGKAAACVSSLSVDLGFTMVFPGLMHGACLHIPPASICADPDAFASYNDSHSIDLLKITPSHLRALLKVVNTLPREVLVVGGEPFGIQLLAAIQKNRPGLRVFNHYGPAETCVGVASQQVDGLDPCELEANGLNSVPVGPPLSSIILRVVDQLGNDVPQDTAGELIVLGPSVSLGYLGMEAETSARFRPTAEGVCYHTGDLAMRRLDGSYVILGRLDRQVKIRGQRVDTAGVETVLRTCPEIREAAVGIRQLGEASPSLIGWVIPAEQYSERAVRSQLKNQLMPFECPALLVTVDSFPQTPGGKLDFNRLPLPAIIPPKHGANPRLNLILAVMTEVMGVPVQQSDTFLDAGGHSLAALRITERLRAQGVIVSLRDIYEAQSMEAIEARSTVSSACDDTNDRHPARISERTATPYEEALWVASLLAGDGSYRLPVVIEFRGGIDRQVVLEAIATLLERHPSFRLKLLDQDGLRIVYGNVAPRIDQMFLFDSDGSDGPDTRAWAMVRNLWAERLAPEEGKTVRAAWIQLEPYRAWFVLIGHHIALDGPSINIFEDELAALLRGTSLEPTSPVVPDGRTTYNVEDKYVPAWVNLESTVRVAVSPTSRETRMLSQLLPSELPRLVEQAAQSLRVTPFSVVLAAWGVVLGHIQSRTQVAIATPSDLRSYSEERMIAYKVNPIVIVVNSNDELSAANIVKAVHESTILELSHRHTPYAHHLQSRRARGLTSSPVSAMLTFDRWNSRVIDNCSFRRLPTSLPCATFDLDLDVIEDDSGNWLLQLHGRGLESEDDLEVYVEKFKCVLREMTKHPERTIIRMPHPLGATGDAAGRVIKGATFNYDDERLHTRLVSRMEAEADARRLIVNDEYCSFKQLDLSSRLWLAVIRAAGIPSGAVLAVDLEPGFDQLAATIAIARHGGIILAMDHMWPSMRKNAVSAGAAAILAKSGEYSNTISINADTLPVEGSVDCVCSPDDGAYIIGTSGSNGCPKLIQISHKAIGNHFGWMRRVRPLKSDDRVLAWTTVSFDVGMWERFAPLAEGATVVIASGLAARDLVQIAELIVKNKITLFQITPTLLRVLLENPSLKEASWPIDVFCGGEFLDDELVARFRHVLPGSRLHNLYGPTETAIDALATFDVNKKGCDTLDEAVDNLEIRVVDEAGRSLGVGEVGELAIAGPSLADGYVRNPEATAARFRALTKDDPKRFYLTGDRARWESQNKLKLVGRADRQVKINGERFELEEIEIALLNGGSVREAVVAQQNGHLVAFVVPATRRTTAAELAAYLRRLIPRTFVPTEWFLVEEIPRTSSGKVDRRSLFPSEASVHRPTTSEVATSRQAEIAEVWREVLGNNCGIDQNFFDVGGNSLTLLKLRTRLKEKLGAEFTIPELFELATISAQARRLENFFDNILPLTIPGDALEAGDNRRELIRRLAAQRED